MIPYVERVFKDMVLELHDRLMWKNEAESFLKSLQNILFIEILVK